MNAPAGGDSGGVTARAGCTKGAGIAARITETCKAARLLVPGKVGATNVAGNCVLTVQQLVRRECEPSGCMQQLCAPL